MNKKYLSVILFSALMLGTTGTFTSCKDYDDDIKNLQEQIDKKASLEELQKQMDAMQADVDAAKAAAEEAKNKAQEALDKANAAGGGDVTSEELQALKDDLQAQIDKLASLEDVQAEIDALKEELADTYATQEALDALKTKVDTLSDKVASIVGNLLNSLVYQPSLYINGIEATEYPWMNYIPLTKSTIDNVTFEDNEGTSCTVITKADEWNYKNQTKNKEFDPVISVDYHVNPSKAKLAKENLSIISGDAEVVNTRASVAVPQLDAATDIKLDKGILTIPLIADGSEILANGIDNKEFSKASIFALQANVKTEEGEDRVVTSDYAALYASVITPQAIAYSVPNYNGFDIVAKDCKENNKNNDELWPSVGEAIAKDPTLRVAYNSEINLKDVLAIHYNQVSLTSTNGTHKVWNWGEEAQYGLKYDFALIQYTAGTNKTSDSKYVDQTLIEKGIVAPRMVEANGETSASTGISSVGRHPLVRVRVLDKDGEVVLHAYIKVEIVQTIENIITDVFNKGEQKFGCQGTTPELTWAEVSNLLLEKVEYSKEEFLALYKVDAASKADGIYAANELYQYQLVDNKFVKVAKDADKYGDVTLIPDEEGTTNPVLAWAINMKEQQSIYDLNGHTKTIYVRYIRKTDNPEGTAQIAPVYLPIKVTVVKPQGTVVKKIAEYWYNDSKNTRLNVQYPKDGGNTEDFTVDLDQVWEGNKPTFGVEGFDSYTATILANRAGAQGGYKYYFTAANNGVKVTDQLGNEYELFAGNSAAEVKVEKATDIFGKEYDVTTENALLHALKSDKGEYLNDALYAKDSKGAIEMIAQISNTTDKCTIKYQNNETAKRILNAYKDELAAQIGICAYSPCNIALSLNGATYPANLLRPITITDNSKGEFLDAQANGSTINIAEVFNFVDWRNVSFYNGDKDYKNVWLYAFYGLNKIEVKTALITTNLNGNDINTKLLSEVTQKIIITQEPNNTAKVIDLKEFNAAKFGTEATWNAIVDAFGKIKYVNNGNNVETFKVRIPVDFTYTWGTIRAYVECTVNSTMGQN